MEEDGGADEDEEADEEEGEGGREDGFGDLGGCWHFGDGREVEFAAR